MSALTAHLSKGVESTHRLVLGPAPERTPVARIARVVAFALVVAFAIGGFVILLRAQGWTVALVLPAGALLWLIGGWGWLRARPCGGCLARALRPLLAVPVAILTVVGFDALCWAIEDHLDWRPLSIGVGLLLATCVFTGTAFLWIRTMAPIRRALGASIALAAFVILGLPILYTLLKSDSPVPPSEPIVSRLDVRIVTARRAPATPPTEPAKLPPAALDEAGGLAVTYSVATVGPDGLRWTLTDSTDPAAAEAAVEGVRIGRADPPAAPEGADTILLLLADGTGPAIAKAGAGGDRRAVKLPLSGWEKLARRAAPRATTTFALLRTTSRERLRRWRTAFAAHGGGAKPLSRLGFDSIAAAGLNLAVGSRAADQRLALAVQFRPILRLDSREPDREPLNIDALFREGAVRLCSDVGKGFLGLGGSDCQTVTSSADLTNGPNHLEITPPQPDEPVPGGPPTGPPGRATTIYVHPVAPRGDRKGLVYLDYWWYFPENPADEVGGGAFCGPGLAVAGVTCFNHHSDWEGITVVVDTTGLEAQPVAVHYAQHSNVVAYRWSDLAAGWERLAAAAHGKGSGSFTAGIDDAGVRPLVFVASGTHSSYPLPCPAIPSVPGVGRADCHQVVHSERQDSAHDGAVDWAGNVTATCLQLVCVQPVPTRNGGRDPALWNAYTGQWGNRDCFIVYCSTGDAPGAPASAHDRYTHPGRCSDLYSPGGARIGDDCDG